LFGATVRYAFGRRTFILLSFGKQRGAELLAGKVINLLEGFNSCCCPNIVMKAASALRAPSLLEGEEQVQAGEA